MRAFAPRVDAKKKLVIPEVKLHRVVDSQIRTKKDFQRKVLQESTEKPCLVLLKSKADDESLTLEKDLIESMDIDDMRLVVLDAEEISNDLRDGLSLNKTPSVMLIYRQQVATHIKGTPTDQELTELFKLARICYDVTREDNMLDDLLKSGQKALVT